MPKTPIPAFEAELASLKAPVAQDKIFNITKLALSDYFKYFKFVVFHIERTIAKARSNMKVPLLYVIDSIINNSRHKHGEDEPYAPRFQKHITQTFQHLFKCSSADQERVLQVLKMWKERNIYPAELIDSLVPPALREDMPDTAGDKKKSGGDDVIEDILDSIAYDDDDEDAAARAARKRERQKREAAEAAEAAEGAQNQAPSAATSAAAIAAPTAAPAAPGAQPSSTGPAASAPSSNGTSADGGGAEGMASLAALFGQQGDVSESDLLAQLSAIVEEPDGTKATAAALGASQQQQPPGQQATPQDPRAGLFPSAADPRAQLLAKARHHHQQQQQQQQQPPPRPPARPPHAEPHAPPPHGSWPREAAASALMPPRAPPQGPEARQLPPVPGAVQPSDDSDAILRRPPPAAHECPEGHVRLMSSTLWIKSLSEHATSEELHSLLKDYGIRSPKHVKVEANKHQAFIILSSHQATATAKRNFNGFTIHGRPVQTAFAKGFRQRKTLGWDSDTGVSYVHLNDIDPQDLRGYTEGCVVDRATCPVRLLEDLNKHPHVHYSSQPDLLQLTLGEKAHQGMPPERPAPALRPGYVPVRPDTWKGPTDMPRARDSQDHDDHRRGRWPGRRAERRVPPHRRSISPSEDIDEAFSIRRPRPGGPSGSSPPRERQGHPRRRSRSRSPLRGDDRQVARRGSHSPPPPHGRRGALLPPQHVSPRSSQQHHPMQQIPGAAPRGPSLPSHQQHQSQPQQPDHQQQRHHQHQQRPAAPPQANGRPGVRPPLPPSQGWPSANAPPGAYRRPPAPPPGAHMPSHAGVPGGHADAVSRATTGSVPVAGPRTQRGPSQQYPQYQEHNQPQHPPPHPQQQPASRPPRRGSRWGGPAPKKGQGMGVPAPRHPGPPPSQRPPFPLHQLQPQPQQP